MSLRGFFILCNRNKIVFNLVLVQKTTKYHLILNIRIKYIVDVFNVIY